MSVELQRGPETLAEPTEARFTMRALLIVMAVVAVLAALAGPIVRGLQPETRFRLLSLWSVWLLASVAWLGYLAYQRREAERLVGQAQIRLPLFDETLPAATPARRWWNVVLTGFFALLMMCSFSLFVADPSSGRVSRDLVINFVLIGCGVIYWTARTVTSVWWRTNVRFGERGILWDRRAMVWDHIVSWAWNARSPDILEIHGIDQVNRDMTLRVSVAADQREPAEALLRLHVLPKPAVEIKVPMSALARAPLSVAAHDPRFLKYLGLVLLVPVAMFIGAHFFSAGFTGIREFDQTVVLGLCLGPLAERLWHRQGTAQVGTPIVRLMTSRQWLVALATSLAAGGAYWIGKTLGPTSEYFAYASGIAFGALVGATIGPCAEAIRHTSEWDFHTRAVLALEGGSIAEVGRAERQARVGARLAASRSESAAGAA